MRPNHSLNRVARGRRLLFRLQRLGVDVGNRWEQLADKAEARIGDCPLMTARRLTWFH
jgi:hypothetical protein